jgi:hypothetical protein
MRLVTRVLDVVQVTKVHLLLGATTAPLVKQVGLSVRVCDVAHVHVLWVHQPMGPMDRQGIANEQSALLLDLGFLVAVAGMKQMGKVHQLLLLPEAGQLAHVKQLISWALDQANVARVQSSRSFTSRHVDRSVVCGACCKVGAAKLFEWYEEFAGIGALPLSV